MSGNASQIELTVVVPTYNEIDNVEILANRIAKVLEGERWEFIFVDDDSPDGTHEKIREMGALDSRIRLIHRIDRKGLSSACLEGMLASTAPFVAIIDADLQHDETLLKFMLKIIRKGEVEIIVASRKSEGGSFGEMPGIRVKMSEFARWITERILQLPLSDPMSGNFMIRRKIVVDIAPKLYGQGFKLLLDICANAGRKLAIHELPYTMRARQLGDSKLGFGVIIDYMLFLFSNALGRLIPVRFLKFCLIGGTGVLVHLSVLGVLHRLIGVEFLVSQIIAAYTAMASNYVLNNQYTFTEMRKTGRHFWIGMINFFVVCSLGALIGITGGEFLHRTNMVWWGAGLVTTVLAAIWNFSVSSIFTWRKVTETGK